MSLPKSWAEVYDRLDVQWANDHDGPEWVSQAIYAKWGVRDVGDLTRTQRTLAFQRVSGVTVWIEENWPEDLAFMIGNRPWIAAAFARYFDGFVLEGPPWRLDPTETERLVYKAWVEEALSVF